MESWRIVIADDESLMASALKLFLELADDLDVVGVAENGLEAVSLCRELRPHVVLMDLQMPVLDGVSATRRISAEWPDIKVVVVDGRAPISPKITGALIDTIRSSHGTSPRIGPPPTAPPLSSRELEVLDLLAQGLGNLEMARELHLTESAVKARLAGLSTKFGVGSRVQVLVRACELGLVQPHLRVDDSPAD